jgi:hypothetical protein
MEEGEVPISWKETVKRNEAYRWKVYHTISQGTVCLSLIHGMTTLNNTDILIPPPNWIERLCGITHKSKIEKAFHKQKERCRRLDEQDARDRMLKREMDKIQVGLSEQE